MTADQKYGGGVRITHQTADIVREVAAANVARANSRRTAVVLGEEC